MSKPQAKQEPVTGMVVKEVEKAISLKLVENF